MCGQEIPSWSRIWRDVTVELFTNSIVDWATPQNNVLQNYVGLLYVFMFFNTIIYSFLLQVSEAALSPNECFSPHSKSE
jgi:hypothetical protein